MPKMRISGIAFGQNAERRIATRIGNVAETKNAAIFKTKNFLFEMTPSSKGAEPEESEEKTKNGPEESTGRFSNILHAFFTNLFI